MRFVVISLAFLSLVACTAAEPTPNVRSSVPQTVWQNSNSGDLVHQLTGTTFPIQAGEYTRTRNFEFRKDGSDVGITYKLQSKDGFGEVTLYVTRASNELQECFDSASSSIVNRYEGTKLLHQGTLVSLADEFPDGPLRVFSWNVKGKNLHTGVWVARKGDWLLKARFTYEPKVAKMVGELQDILNKEIAKDSDKQVLVSTPVNEDGSLADMNELMAVLKSVGW